MNAKELKQATIEKLLEKETVYQGLICPAYSNEYIHDELFGMYFKYSNEKKVKELKTMYALWDVLQENQIAVPNIKEGAVVLKQHHLRVALFFKQKNLSYYHEMFSNNWIYSFRYLMNRLDYSAILEYPKKTVHHQHFATVELLNHIRFCLYSLKEEKNTLNLLEQELFHIYRPLKNLEELQISLHYHDWKNKPLDAEKNLKTFFSKEDIAQAQKIYQHLYEQYLSSSN